MGLFKSIGNFFGDVAKGVAYSVAAPVSSITGHKYKPEFRTKAGSVLAGGSNIGIDSLHLIGKSFADAATGSLATKIANTVRKKENKETAFNYNELQNWHKVDTGVEFIDKGFNTLQKVSKGGAVLLGQAYGVKGIPGTKSPEEIAVPSSGTGTEKVSTGNAVGVAALAIGAAVILK